MDQVATAADAGGALGPRTAANARRAARRAAQVAARDATQGRLSVALARVLCLETEVETWRCSLGPGCTAERLAIAAPAVSAELAGLAPFPSDRARRNLALHHPGILPAAISAMDQSELNRAQRSGRSKPPSSVPASEPRDGQDPGVKEPRAARTPGKRTRTRLISATPCWSSG